MIRADLHIHSCLSPCGDDEMTPFDLVGLAKLNGLDLIALTDHNSAKNCRAAAAAAAEYEMGFIPGIEVNTSEDIHCVCVFPGLDEAEAFGEEIYGTMPPIKNEPAIFGNQIWYEPDGTPHEEERLLLSACGYSILDLPELCAKYGGICWPAHVDRETNGMLAALGTWPPDLLVRAAEIRFIMPPEVPDGLHIIQSSDAHRPEDLPEEGYPLRLNEPTFEALKAWIET